MTRSGFCPENMDEVGSRLHRPEPRLRLQLQSDLQPSDSSLAPDFWPKDYALFHTTQKPVAAFVIRYAQAHKNRAITQQ